jgi:hypothetical protein
MDMRTCTASIIAAALAGGTGTTSDSERALGLEPVKLTEAWGLGLLCRLLPTAGSTDAGGLLESLLLTALTAAGLC